MHPPCPRLSSSLLPALGTCLLTGVLSGCAALGVGGASADGSSAGSGSEVAPVEGRPAVVAAFYPLAWVSEQVAGDRADVVNLTTPGGEPHDLELGVQQTAEVAAADLVVFEGGFQPAVDAAVEQGGAAGPASILDVTDVVELQEYAGEHEEHADHEGEDHAGEEAAGEDHAHDESLDGLDPHFWLDPLRMAQLAEAVADRLSALDPAGSEAYAANAADVAASLEDLDADYEAGLATCKRSTVVVNHEAFGYLTRYGLDFEPITGLTPDAEPTPGDLARLQRLIRDEGITTVFYERLVSPQTAEVLAADTGVRSDVLDPLEGLTDATASEDYLSLMRANLAALERAGGC